MNPTFNVAEVENLIDTFNSRPDDVFICTYPKCGTTWTQQIVHLLTHDGEQGDTNIYDTAPWLETIYAAPILHEREAGNVTLEQLEEKPSPRFFKSHADVPSLPCGGKPTKVITISRNPKVSSGARTFRALDTLGRRLAFRPPTPRHLVQDACVSMYKHAGEKLEFGMKGKFSDFVKLFLSGQCECGSFFDFTNEWYAESLRNPENVLWMTYEEMVADPSGSICKIAKFIGIGDLEPDSELIQKTVEKSSVASMKASSGVYAGNVRQGGIGNWRKHFSEEDSALFDEVYQKQMEGVGLTYNFGDGLVM